jgi:anhydro-N-acetylmuramic acid kinase
MSGLNNRPANAAFCIGLMSGTSLDGVDAVLADFSGGRPAVRGAVYAAFRPELRAALLGLQVSGQDELHRAAVAANALVDCYAAAVTALLRDTGVGAGEVAAIGAHGQTVRHRPAEGYTWQINNPARLAEVTGIAVVADFRSRDVAAGGQGAPLVPAFHAALFQDPRRHRVVVNIGGIANITNLPPGSPGVGVTGWDTGPGNVFLDAWCDRHRHEPFDRDGAWAASGVVRDELLRRFLADPYFTKNPPKSTGRDLFNMDWLDARLQGSERPEDVQATLLRLTAETIARDVMRGAGASQILICGGGARNTALMRGLAAALSAGKETKGDTAAPLVQTTDDFGVPANQVEALAFAWLARRILCGEPGNLPAVTGARGARLLGAIYPA